MHRTPHRLIVFFASIGGLGLGVRLHGQTPADGADKTTAPRIIDKKPAFFAYSFLNQLGDKELVNQDDRSWATRDETGGIQALFWDLTDLRGKDPADDWDFFRRVLVPESKGLVALKLRDLKPGPYHLSISRVGYEKNDAYTAYLKMGHPSQISPEQVAALTAQATGAPDEERDITIDDKGTWQANFPIREDDVILVKLKPSGVL